MSKNNNKESLELLLGEKVTGIRQCQKKDLGGDKIDIVFRDEDSHKVVTIESASDLVVSEADIFTVLGKDDCMSKEEFTLLGEQESGVDKEISNAFIELWTASSSSDKYDKKKWTNFRDLLMKSGIEL